jgi:hypothetical protein
MEKRKVSKKRGAHASAACDAAANRHPCRIKFRKISDIGMTHARDIRVTSAFLKIPVFLNLGFFDVFNARKP